MRFIGAFMAVFGLVSSVFDVLTFGALRLGFQAPADVFRTAWFVESLLTELVVAFVVRTRRPMFCSRPGAVLLMSTLALVPVTLAIPSLPFASLFGFVPLPASLLVTVMVITAAYVVAAEAAKHAFYRRQSRQSSTGWLR